MEKNKIENINLHDLVENQDNPRSIEPQQMQKLVESILTFPKMLQMRPIVCNENRVILGGNMRFRALLNIEQMEDEAIKNAIETVAVKLTDAEKARVIERGVESPQARLEAIERIANAGAGGATLRLRPFIIGVSTPTYLDLIKEAFNRGATALSTEFFCLETRSPTLRELLPTISKMAGFDILAFYKKYSVQSGYLRLNRKVKEPFFRNMKELCDQLGMRFYVSDAHFKELCHNGSCCGLPPTWNYSRGQMCEALNICKRKGYVRWSDIKLDAENLLRARLEKAMNLGTREKYSKYYTMSAADYMKWCWNNPQAAHSPYKMFEGAMLPADERDSEGNIVYKYNGAEF